MSVHNPFVDPLSDPRAAEIQEKREQMAAGQAAATSLAPNYELLKHLTQWMSERGYSAKQIAHAVREPERYWEYFQVEIDALDMNERPINE